MFAIFGIGLTLIISIYNQHESDKKEQAVIVQQKEEDVKIENQKQEELVKELEEKKLEAQKKADEANVKEETSADSTLNENTKKDEFTKEKAIEIVRKIIISKNPKVKVDYDHIQKRDGKDYYVIRVYDDMADHISTLGWYYVQGDTGKAFEWDLIEDTLIPIN